MRSTRRCRRCARSRRRSPRPRKRGHATKAYGATSLWDAIAETAQKISDRQRRRALVVITDGVDSASTMKPSDVSAIASSLDVPVYILVIAFALDEAAREGPMRGPMADLAAWTGGDSLDRLRRTKRARGDEPATGRAPSSIHCRVRAWRHAGMARARAAGPQARAVRPRAQRLHGEIAVA